MTVQPPDSSDEFRPRVSRLPLLAPQVFPRQAVHAADAGAAAAADLTRATSLAMLLASHVLRDGELVLLILKPSLWFIPFSSAAFAAIAFVASVAFTLSDHGLHQRYYFCLAGFAIAARLMWAVLQWQGRLYVLTDMRVLRLAGVFNVDIFDCALRKIVRTRIVSPLRERLVLVGSIEIIPRDEETPTAIWQTIPRPREVHQRLLAAIRKARQNNPMGD